MVTSQRNYGTRCLHFRRQRKGTRPLRQRLLGFAAQTSDYTVAIARLQDCTDQPSKTNKQIIN